MLLETPDGLLFEALDEAEAAFLYEEVFVRRAYAGGPGCGVDVQIQLPFNDAKAGEDSDEDSDAEGGARLVIDVGANIGLFALWCIQQSPHVHVLAFEPLPPIFKTLAVNVAPWTRVKAVAAGVSEAPEEAATFHYFPHAPGESTRHLAEAQQLRKALAGEAEGTENAVPASVDYSAPITTISQLLRSLRVPSIDLLKIDCEGDELAVLRGIAAEDWPKIQQVVAEVHDTDDRLATTVKLLQSQGFRVATAKQHSTVVDGYCSVIPQSMRLYYVYATRAAVP